MMALAQSAGAVNHHIKWAASATGLSVHDALVLRLYSSPLAKTLRQPETKLGARFPIVRAGAELRAREVMVWATAKWHAAIDAVLGMNVVAQFACFLQRHVCPQ